MVKYCIWCAKEFTTEMRRGFFCSRDCERNYEDVNRLTKEINKREDFIDMVDNRDTDPDFTEEQQKIEDEKYERYEKEIKELKEKRDEISKTSAKWEIVV
jgi:hypothetical protein